MYGTIFQRQRIESNQIETQLTHIIVRKFSTIHY